MGWQWAAEEWAYGQDIDISSYRHRVIITSPGKANWMTAGDPDCAWSGMGVLGPAYNAAGEQNMDGTAVYSQVNAHPRHFCLVESNHVFAAFKCIRIATQSC